MKTRSFMKSPVRPDHFHQKSPSREKPNPYATCRYKQGCSDLCCVESTPGKYETFMRHDVSVTTIMFRSITTLGLPMARNASLKAS